ncbi:peptidoglycan editing factor PgeF [Salimicrobium sp. PL1-032A]|uniref:peptidoglycan editing factor PgeF n=1 Tax=Salimicrobium sp. PL1-032A TaxID=3095364 RepID=UPI0032603F5F
MFVPKTNKVLYWQQEKDDISIGFTMRQEGCSAYPENSLNMGLHIEDDENLVIRNREMVAEDTGVPLDDWILAEQVHGTEIELVTESDRGRGARDLHTAIQGADGLITNKENTLLAGFYADCVPLYFMDPVTDWIGIAHAGWKGSVNGMAHRMVEAMSSCGANVETLTMIIGPSISGDVYTVDERVSAQVDERYRPYVLKQIGENAWGLDLKELNKRVAMEAGIKEENVFTSSFCTYKEEELFFSHRRDEGQTGRMLGFIVRSK